MIGERGVYLVREAAWIGGNALLDLDRVGHDPAPSRRGEREGHGGEYAVADQPGSSRISGEARRCSRGLSRCARRWTRGGRGQGTRRSSTSRRKSAGGRMGRPGLCARMARRARGEDEHGRENSHRANRPNRPTSVLRREFRR
jgi:hypothetical protein